MDIKQKHEFNVRRSKEIVYIWYDWENCAIKSIPLNDGSYECWVKFKGEEPFKAKPEGTLVFDAFNDMDIIEITEKKYNDF